MALIIQILGTAHPFRGGLAVFNERLARAFISEGNKVCIETFSLQYPSFLFPGKSQYSEEPVPEGLDIHVSVNSVNPFTWWKTGRRIRKQNPDILIIKFWLPFMGPCLGFIARSIKKNGHTRVISILDNVIPHEKRPGDRMFARYFIRSVDGFVAMSQSVMDDLGQFDQQKPRLFCPHPLYDNFGKAMPREEALKMLNLDPNYKYILFFGIIRRYKGLDLLLEAFADERFGELPVKLIVTGEYYGDEAFYGEIIKKHHLETRVIVKNFFVPDHDVAQYFCAVDIVAQPYRSATQSGVTQIAYHFEKPMLVTNVGGLAEIVPHGRAGYVTEPEPKQIADALIDFFVANRYEEMLVHVKEEKKKYLWDNMTRTIMELYKQMNS